MYMEDSMIKRFRTKPVEIEAILFTGDNFEEIEVWSDGYFNEIDEEDRTDDPEATAEVFDVLHSTWILVKPGQWIIKGTKGEFYPCDDEVFRQKYEEV